VTKKRTHEEAMKAAEQERWRAEAEAIDAMTGDEVDAELRSFGGDPAKIRAAGAAHAATLHKEKTGEDLPALPWEERAAAKLEEVRRLAGTVRKTKLSRADMLAKVEEARNDPRFKKPVGALFRKRTPEEASDEELEAMLEAIELLGRIDE
jgi:hypothetical protein